MWVEEAQQQRLTHAAPHVDAALDVALERVAPGNHDQRADARAREIRHRARDGLDHVGPGAGSPASEPRHRDAFEQAPQVLLEHHDQHQHHGREEALEQPDRELELELLGQQVESRQDGEAHRRETRACGAQPHDQHPEQDCHDGDVRDVAQPELREHPKHGFSSAGGEVRDGKRGPR